MTKRRIFGIILMVVATLIGTYVGVWQLFIQPVMELIRTYNELEFHIVMQDIIRIVIFCPMIILLSYVLLKIGQLIFQNK